MKTLSTQKTPNFSPHCTDRRFATERLIWGQRKEGDHGVYSDRLSQWDYEKDKLARSKASKKFPYGSPAWSQEFLRQYFDDRSIELTAIYSCFHLGNGFPIQAFCYLQKEDKNDDI
ncbi:hypothetical protein Xen7305DRAFT_00008540 [Xenococcus sp. PCC 7305]|nr:hypothetical protein Xen7305DRAFT_00008540 [Xenococcus sp. PCC 7305]